MRTSLVHPVGAMLPSLADGGMPGAQGRAEVRARRQRRWPPPLLCELLLCELLLLLGELPCEPLDQPLECDGDEDGGLVWTGGWYVRTGGWYVRTGGW